MNDIALIIVMAFINIVVTRIISNLIFLRYQKMVEDSFAKSYLEYQTKFVRNHEKQVGALELLCKNYGEFGNAFIEALNAYSFYTAMDVGGFTENLWEKIDFDACSTKL